MDNPINSFFETSTSFFFYEKLTHIKELVCLISPIIIHSWPNDFGFGKSWIIPLTTKLIAFFETSFSFLFFVYEKCTHTKYDNMFWNWYWWLIADSLSFVESSRIRKTVKPAYINCFFVGRSECNAIQLTFGPQKKRLTNIWGMVNIDDRNDTSNSHCNKHNYINYSICIARLLLLSVLWQGCLKFNSLFMWTKFSVKGDTKG